MSYKTKFKIFSQSHNKLHTEMRYWLPLHIVCDLSVFNSTSNLDKVQQITEINIVIITFD